VLRELLVRKGLLVLRVLLVLRGLLVLRELLVLRVLLVLVRQLPSLTLTLPVFNIEVRCLTHFSRVCRRCRLLISFSFGSVAGGLSGLCGFGGGVDPDRYSKSSQRVDHLHSQRKHWFHSWSR
jgi:hypothetical protein